MKPDAVFDLVALKGVPILVVEDVWQVANALKRVLEQLDITVLGPTGTAMEARRLVANQRPVAALVDVNLKGEMAWSLIDELCEQGIRVVVISGYAQPMAPTTKPIAFLQKPFAEAELMAALHAIVGEAG